MVSAAVRQLNTPPVRRPHASDIHEQKKRPAIAEMLSQTTRPEATGAVIWRTITSKVTRHSPSPTPPV